MTIPPSPVFHFRRPIRVTVAQAKEISKAIQAFGERKTPKKLEPPPKVNIETKKSMLLIMRNLVLQRRLWKSVKGFAALYRGR